MGHDVSPPTKSNDDRVLALLCHIGPLAVGFWAPLVIWLIKKDDSPEIDEHGREALNWQISVTIYAIISGILMIVFIGIFLLIAIMIVNLVTAILGGIAAYNGRPYRYPMCLRFITGPDRLPPVDPKHPAA